MGESFPEIVSLKGGLSVDNKTKLLTSSSVFSLLLLQLTDLLLFDFSMDAFVTDVRFLILSMSLLTASLEIAELSDISRSAKENGCSPCARVSGVCFVPVFVRLS